MVDKASLGSVGVPFRLDVERGKVIEFARAIHSSHPEHTAGDHPISPPTFLTTILFWDKLVPESNPWSRVDMNQKRGLHAEQEFIFHGPPPRAGAKLTCQSRIAEIYDKEGRRGGTLTFAVMVTELRDDTGKLVAEARMTGVETALPGEEA